MKYLISILSTILFASGIWAQAPQSFKYQAVARDNAGEPITDQVVSFRISILEGGASGNAVYVETHSATANNNGLINMSIGDGFVVNGDFSTIAWGGDSHFLRVEMDVAGGTDYQLMGTSQLLSVPYALHAQTATSIANDNVDDADADPNNELITSLEINNNTLEISDMGGLYSADLSPYLDNTDMQTLSVSGNELSISNGNSVLIPSTDNQTLSLAGGTLSISNGNAVNLPVTQYQILNLEGNTLSISNGNSVTLSDTGANTLDKAYDEGGAGAGRIITADAGAVEISTNSSNAIALNAIHSNTGVSIAAQSSNSGNSFSTIQASTNSNSNAASAIIGNTDGTAWGVSGQAGATSSANAGVYGSNLRTNGGHGVLGIGVNGVVGQTNYRNGFGVYGWNTDSQGPLTDNAVGTYGIGYIGVWGDNLGTGGFSIYSNGDLGASGVKSFAIDHPNDPENKYLKHFSIESDEVLNVYRGNAAFNQAGEAEVVLPDYFEDVNRNYSYQLTPVGAYAPLYIKEKIADGRFIIAGGQPGMEVSWAVYAERNDPYLQQHPEKRAVEPEKEAWNKGRYLMPHLYNQSDDKKIVKPLPPQRQVEAKLLGD